MDMLRGCVLKVRAEKYTKRPQVIFLRASVPVFNFSILVFLLLLVLSFGGAAAGDPSVTYDFAPVALDEKFTLGPFSDTTLAIPLEVEVAIKDPQADIVLVELDEGEDEIGLYPGFPVREGVRSSLYSFVPVSREGATEWPGGKKRHFLIRESSRAPAVGSPLEISRRDNLITFTNKYYSLSLVDPEVVGFERADSIIHAITFGDSGSVLHSIRTGSDIWDGRVSHRWEFDPGMKSGMRQYGDYAAAVEYAGRFNSGDGPLENLTWRLSFIFYHALPLVKVNVRVDQKAAPHAVFPLCRFLQINFNPSDADSTLKQVERVAGGRRGHRDLLAAYGPGAFLGIIAFPYGPTTGNVHAREGWGYICGIWENEMTVVDAEFYLVVTDDVSIKERMDAYWKSFLHLSEVNDRIRMMRLFSR